MEYYSAIKRNAFECVLMRWMKRAYYTARETPIQYINAYIWNQKNGNDDPIYKAAKETDVKNRLLDSVGEGEGGMISREQH